MSRPVCHVAYRCGLKVCVNCQCVTDCQIVIVIVTVTVKVTVTAVTVTVSECQTKAAR